MSAYQIAWDMTERVVLRRPVAFAGITSRPIRPGAAVVEVQLPGDEWRVMAPFSVAQSLLVHADGPPRRHVYCPASGPCEVRP